MVTRIELHEKTNTGCKKGCNKEERKHVTENDLCTETLSVIDKLPVRCVGPWAIQKIYLLYQYFGIFSNGMKNKWPLNYIEICSGPGRCIDRENGIELDGTALSIIQHPSFLNIKQAYFFDYNEDVVTALNTRISKLNIHNAKAYNADYKYSESICNILSKEVSKDSLNIVFIDPTDCSVPFSLIENIKKTLNKVDFIINIASGTDFNRNVKGALLNQHKNLVLKYSNFLNSTDFFRDPVNMDLARSGKMLDLRNNFRESYKKAMMNIGYRYFDFIQIKQFYDILYATENKKGIEFWNKATNINFVGQRKLL